MISSYLQQVATFSFPFEAHIAKASLDAAGIPSFIADEHTINMQWLYSNALGGIRLLVPTDHLSEARELLAQDYSQNLAQQVDVQQETCEVCKSTNIEPFTKGKKPAFMVFLLLGFPLFFYKHCIKCNDCGALKEQK